MRVSVLQVDLRGETVVVKVNKLKWVPMIRQSFVFSSVLFVILAAGFTFAQDSAMNPQHQEVEIQTPKKLIKGIFVTGKQENIFTKGQKEISDVKVENLDIPNGPENLEKILRPYLNKQVNKIILASILQDLKQFYRTNKYPVNIKIFPKAANGVLQILITQKEAKVATTSQIKGIFITGNEADILKEGRDDIHDVQLVDLEIPGKYEEFQTAILPFIHKEMTKEQLTNLQKEITLFFRTHQLPPVTVKVLPKKSGVVQVLVSKNTKKEKAKKAPKKAGKKGSKKKAKPKVVPVEIKGIYVTGNPDAIQKEGRNLEGILVEDLGYPIWPDAFQCFLSRFIGQKTTKKELADLRKELIHYINVSTGNEVSLHVTYTIRHGVIQALITRRRVGKITYKGTKWMSEAQIAHIFNVHQGELVNKDHIRNNFAWLNQNVFHQSTIKFTPSKVTPGDIDILITTKDRFPLKFSISGDNSGTPSIGREKLSASVSWGNAFWMNDVMTYSYSTSNIFKRYSSHTINYLAYLPWQHTFTFFGNTSTSKPGIENVRSLSWGNQMRVRYNIPYKPLYTRFLQTLGFGFDVKYGHGYSLKLDKPHAIPGIKKGQVAQLVGNYTLYNTTKKHNFSLILNLYWSPGRLLEHQSKKEFNARRTFSQAHYAYFNLAITDIYQLPYKYSLATALTIQKATATLPGSELFGIGGYNTVRGYRPYEFNSDNGLIANVELRTPNYQPLKHFYKKVDDKLFFLIFLDYGIGYNYNHTVTSPKLPKDKREQWALGTGLGLRYQIQQYLSFRCDYGFKLHKMQRLNKEEKRARGGNGELHVGLLLSY